MARKGSKASPMPAGVRIALFVEGTNVLTPRNRDDQPTIGLLLCRGKNQLVVEYALRGSTRPMGVADWETRLVDRLPADLAGSLPTIEQIAVREHGCLGVSSIHKRRVSPRSACTRSHVQRGASPKAHKNAAALAALPSWTFDESRPNAAAMKERHTASLRSPLSRATSIQCR